MSSVRGQATMIKPRTGQPLFDFAGRLQVAPRPTKHLIAPNVIVPSTSKDGVFYDLIGLRGANPGFDLSRYFSRSQPFLYQSFLIQSSNVTVQTRHTFPGRNRQSGDPKRQCQCQRQSSARYGTISPAQPHHHPPPLDLVPCVYYLFFIFASCLGTVLRSLSLSWRLLYNQVSHNLSLPPSRRSTIGTQQPPPPPIRPSARSRWVERPGSSVAVLVGPNLPDTSFKEPSARSTERGIVPLTSAAEHQQHLDKQSVHAT